MNEPFPYKDTIECYGISYSEIHNLTLYLVFNGKLQSEYPTTNEG